MVGSGPMILRFAPKTAALVGLVACLVGLATAGWTPAALAQSIPAGTFEWTLAIGGGASLDIPSRANETVTSVQVVPHVGYFLTDEVGEGLVRGNFELIAEPTLIHLKATPSATVGGLAIVPRWVFAPSVHVRPYLEVGGGILGGHV